MHRAERRRCAISLPGLILLIALSQGMLGCTFENAPIAAVPIAPMTPTSAIAPHIYLVHLPGMAGWTQTDVSWVRGFGDAGISRHLEIYDWTSPNRLIGAVLAYDHNRAAARYIAGRIAAKLREEPDAKIILTGWSAGGAVAVWTLEDLPEGMQVQSVMLMQPAVNPDHDLSKALRHVRGHFFATQSRNDWLLLGIGTMIFGTADGGAHTPAAGNAGFRMPATGDAVEYLKLVEIPYQSDWTRYGNYGGHIGPLDRGFAREVLGPMIH